MSRALPPPAIAAMIAALALPWLAALPVNAEAMPTFARREGLDCGACHQAHYPRLNALGRRYQENGYRLVSGADAPPIGATDSGLPAQVPLAFRGQAFAKVPAAAPLDGGSSVQPSVGSFLVGGGSIGPRVSYAFSGSIWPDPALHHAHVGVHDLAEGALGPGAVNVRAGSLLLLDFARPGHRDLFPAPAPAITARVGANGFALDDPQLGAQVYGRPGRGPLWYEAAVVAGDSIDGADRDDGKDLFARVSYTALSKTPRPWTLSAFGYRGRSDIVTTTPDLVLVQSDRFWLVGGDTDVTLGKFALSGLGYASRHADPGLEGAPVRLAAWRVEGVLAASPEWSGSVRYEAVASTDDDSLDAQQVSAHVAYAMAPNALLLVGWRHDLLAFSQSSAVLAVDAAF